MTSSEGLSKFLNDLLLARFVGDKLVKHATYLLLQIALDSLWLGVLATIASIAEPGVHLLDRDITTFSQTLFLLHLRIRIAHMIVEPLVENVHCFVRQLVFLRH